MNPLLIIMVRFALHRVSMQIGGWVAVAGAATIAVRSVSAAAAISLRGH